MPFETTWTACGSGPPTVLIHGLGLDRRMWRRQVPPLVSAGHRVFVCDLLGHGRSERPRQAGGMYSGAELAESLTAALDLAGIGSAAFIGFSLGGAVALQIALSSPNRVKRLALVSTSAWMGPEADTVFTTRAAAVEAHGVEVLVEPAVQRWFTPGFVRTHNAEVEDYKQVLRENDPCGYAAACRGLAAFDVRHQLRDIRCPTLVLVGDHDRATPPAMAQDLATNIRGARLEILGPAGHLVTEECADRINETIIRFLATAPGTQKDGMEGDF